VTKGYPLVRFHLIRKVGVKGELQQAKGCKREEKGKEVKGGRGHDRK
jgi:hypothetical protein